MQLYFKKRHLKLIFFSGKNSSKSVFRPWDDEKESFDDVEVSKIKDEPKDSLDESSSIDGLLVPKTEIKDVFSPGSAQGGGMNPATGSWLSTGEINELRLRQLDSLSIAYRGIHLQNRSVCFISKDFS